ncbi:MAG: D-alanyl-D-alanine endopeptidase [Casimicrobiaceae bacterium]|nr:D-alanyl-D-alanine endopeptidase [Casimicrobiaceae bacterium]
MKFASYIFAFAQLFAFVAAPQGHAAGGPNVLAQVALIVDARSGEPIFAKNADRVAPIASITKLMTAMVVLDAGQPLDELLRIEIDDVDFLKGSRSRLAIGTQLTRREMLRLALMSSENRSAHALARYYPGGVSAAVRAMNAKARALGMHRTRFVDPTGLSPENVSTAEDLTRLVAAAEGYALIREFSTQRESEVALEPGGRTLLFGNSNQLVRSEGWNILLQKTGFIREAGRCMVMLAQIASRPVILVLLDSAGRLGRIGDAQRIRTWMETGEVLPLPSPEPVRKLLNTGQRSKYLLKAGMKRGKVAIKHKKRRR